MSEITGSLEHGKGSKLEKIKKVHDKSLKIHINTCHKKTNVIKEEQFLKNLEIWKKRNVKKKTNEITESF
jgi:hypothetical protein